MPAPLRDVAIYAPEANLLYERGPEQPLGGAEFQTSMLMKGLAGKGLRVAHIVFPVAELSPPAGERMSVVQREPQQGRLGVVPRAAEARAVWRAMAEADARIYVFRAGSAALGVTALFCRAHRRKLVFATASDLDLTFEPLLDNRPNLELYRLGIRLADAVVVQTDEQAALARDRLQRLRRLSTIRSFAEPARPTPHDPEAFVWIGRTVPYKRPLEYLDLAEALPEARFRMIARDTGQTPPELADEVRRRAGALPNVELLPVSPRETTLALLDRAVASVSTSRVEGMPNVFLEAWARGVPVLTLDSDPDGRVRTRGLGVAAGGSWEAFVDGARELWRSRGHREELSHRTRTYVEAVHAPPAVTEDWFTLLAEVGPARRPPVR